MGKPFQVSFDQIVRTRPRIDIKRRVFFANLGLLQQLGVLPPWPALSGTHPSVKRQAGSGSGWRVSRGRQTAGQVQASGNTESSIGSTQRGAC